MQSPRGIVVFALAVLLLLALPFSGNAQQFGHLVRIEQLTFHPDNMTVPGDVFAVLVVQNREDGPIQHEVTSKDLFESGTLIAVQGTGTVEYRDRRVASVLLNPGEEVVIWFYPAKGLTYVFECNINGHAMQATIRAM